MKHYIVYLFLFISSLAFAQQAKKVDFKTVNADLSFDFPQKKVMGTAVYTFEILDKNIDTITIDARNMKFDDVTVNGKKAKYVATNSALKLYKSFKKGTNTLQFNYTAQPKQTMYFVGEEKDLQIWTQGQGKYTSHWLPSFDDVNEKMIFSISATFDTSYTVLANGELKKQSVDNGKQKWEYEMKEPMSSYLAMIAIGRFTKEEQLSASGTPLEFYLRKGDNPNKFEPTYRYSKEMFNFFEQEIGVKYPWKVYRQVPVLDFLYAGMENTTSTIFAQDFVVDSIGFNDRTYINVNAHELAHQWFGDIVTAESGKHHWLQEGFATYYALLAEQKIYGDDHFYHELYDIAERLQQVSKTDTIPVLNEKASTLTFYQKGAWALHVLREGVGHDKFRVAVKNYLEKYAFKNVNTDQFLGEINKVSDYDTNSFKRRWLESGRFEVEEAIELIKKNTTMGLYLELGELQDNGFAEKKEVFMKLIVSDAFYAIKEEAIFQTAEVPFLEKADFVRLALKSDDLRLRQAIARTVTTMPVEFVEEYKALLYDRSYITREIALNILCRNFPERQAEFLDIGKNWIGFNDKNLRILWLTLAYKAKDYMISDKGRLYTELESYSFPEYESTIRQNALANLLYLGKSDPVVLRNLVNATLHHKWQFVKFGKDNIRKLLKKEGYRELFESLLPTLPEAEAKKLEALLAEK